MIILNAKLDDNVKVILNPSHIVMIKDYGDGAVISTTLNSRTGKNRNVIRERIQRRSTGDDTRT